MLVKRLASDIDECVKLIQGQGSKHKDITHDGWVYLARQERRDDVLLDLAVFIELGEDSGHGLDGQDQRSG